MAASLCTWQHFCLYSSMLVYLAAHLCIWQHRCVYGKISGYMAAYVCICQLCVSGNIFVCMAAYLCIWQQICVYGGTSVCVAACIWQHICVSGSISVYVPAYQCSWHHICVYGSISLYMATKTRSQVPGILGTAEPVLILVLCIFVFFFGSVFDIQNACPRTVTQPFVTVHGHAFWGPKTDRVLKPVFFW